MINQIKDWCDNQKALSRTLEMFWECFESYRDEEFEEFKSVFPNDKADVNLKFDMVTCEIDLPDFSQELIAIYLDIYVCDEKVGWYKQLYMSDGEPFDEYFVIE